MNEVNEMNEMSEMNEMNEIKEALARERVLLDSKLSQV